MSKSNYCYEKSENNDSQKIEYRDDVHRLFFCLKYEKKRNISTRFSYHNVFEIYFLIEGKCKFFIDDTVYVLKPGNLVIIPPDVLHKAYYEKDVPITRYVLYFEPTMLLPKVEEALLSVGHYVRRLTVPTSELVSTFEKIKKENYCPDEMSVPLVQGYLTSIAALISRSIENQESIDIKIQNKLVEAAIAYIKSNYSNDISLEDASKEISVNYRYLSRLFKIKTGVGFNEFLNLYRLSQAKTILSGSPSKSIAEIAFDCGFNDSNYFSVKFKKLFGVSPTDFKNGKKQNETW
ncbi:MAG: AraC family transcriptional regulator [Clostridia bacterium]|nr:AraC family transcriptional regulator [Clostridia bacterium]